MDKVCCTWDIAYDCGKMWTPAPGRGGGRGGVRSPFIQYSYKEYTYKVWENYKYKH